MWSSVWLQYSGIRARLSPHAKCRYGIAYETHRPGRPAGSSDDAGGTGSGPDRDQAAQDRGQSPRQPAAASRRQAASQSGRPAAAPGRRGQVGAIPPSSRAAAGLRAAAAGDRARRDGRGRRPADGARRPTSATATAASSRPRRPASSARPTPRSPSCKDKTLMGYVGAQRLLSPATSATLRRARRLAAGLQRPSRCAGDLQAGAGPPHARLGRADAGELRQHRRRHRRPSPPPAR